MSAIVFIGPSLPPAVRDDVPGLVYLPPAAQGDLYRAARHRPGVIGLVDGHFDGLPAVWHKEILWALGQGIHVVGAASMGALRAAELEAFGMVGVGEIFDSYRDGAVEDDDEVAVLHGPAETGYAAVSEAMVNVRATLGAAVVEGVVGEADAIVVAAAAKGLFYGERTWGRIVREAADAGLSPEMGTELLAWLPVGRVDRKRLDALALVDRLKQMLEDEPAPFQPGFTFAWTDAWDRAVAAPGGDDDGRILDELRLDPARYGALRERALLKLLLHPAASAEATMALRKRLGLRQEEDLATWCREHDVPEEEFARLAAGDQAMATLDGADWPGLAAGILDELRLAGDYRGLRERAIHKRDFLQATGAADAAATSLRTMSGDHDPDATVRGLDLADRAALRRLHAQERLYAQASLGHSDDRGVGGTE